MAVPKRGSPSRKPVSLSPAERANTLGLTAASLDSLLDLMEGSVTPAKGGAVQREFVRWPFRQPSVQLQIIHPGGSAVTMRVACRNVSCGGAGLLHAAFVHPGSRCTLHLPRRSGEVVELHGRIVRCKHVVRMIHELGMKFDAPIDVRQFMPAEAMAEAFSRERVKAEELKGSVLLVDDAPLQQKLMQHLLRETQLRLRIARTVAEGLEAARGPCDVIIADYHLPDATGADLIHRLRDAGQLTPVIICTCDDTPATRDKAMRARPDGFLIKPVPEARLLQALAEFIGGAKAASTPSASGGLREQLAGELKAYGQKLRDTVTGEDAMGAFVVCKQIRAEAPMVGMEALGERAGRVADALSATMKVSDCREELEEVARLCDGPARPARPAA